MDFIGSRKPGETLVELKYCERCGGLWLRPRGGAGVHCASCHVRFAALPDPGEAPPGKVSRRKARLQVAKEQRGGLPIPARIDHLQGVAVMEVRA